MGNSMKSTDIDLSIYKFVFAVRASDWDEVIKILKNELGIIEKYNASSRRIVGLFIVSCFIDEVKLTKDFYTKVSNSDNITIHSDGKSTSLYPKIMGEVQIVEERLRWLLLHVSDALDDYTKLLGFENSNVIEEKELDPLTSRLSFEKILSLLALDQSWLGSGVDNNKMRTIIENSDNFQSFKAAYLNKTTPKTVWKSISEIVLERPVKWQTIYKKLNSIRLLRNKCAHFHTVTEDDLTQMRHLKTQVMNSLTKEKNYSSTDFKAFAELSKQLAETISHFSESYIKSITTLTEAVSASQKSLQLLSGGVYKGILDPISSSKSLMDSYYSGILNTGLKKANMNIDTSVLSIGQRVKDKISNKEELKI